jgi:hypothetical protein
VGKGDEGREEYEERLYHINGFPTEFEIGLFPRVLINISRKTTDRLLSPGNHISYFVQGRKWLCDHKKRIKIASQSR